MYMIGDEYGGVNGKCVRCDERGNRGSCNLCFFFQAEDGIRDAQESRGLGDVYKRQHQYSAHQRMILACRVAQR